MGGFASLLLAACAAAQDPVPGVDQKRVDAAIQKGSAFLINEAKGRLEAVRHPLVTVGKEELVLYTLVYGGVDPSDETFKNLLDHVLAKELTTTYSVSLMAMALEAIDKRKYQERLAQCAQFLVDTQCVNGQWGYGKPAAPDAPTPAHRSDVATGGGSRGGKGKPEGTQAGPPTITIKRRGQGPANGDNSNSQYALLGLRACVSADVNVPLAVFADAERWWERTQNRDGGWPYDMAAAGVGKEESYGSMTAGAVGALVICKHYLKKEIAKAGSVQMGLKWLGSHLLVNDNPNAAHSVSSPGDSKLWHYYWLYALERAGRLAGTETMGKHEWYREGANYLLDGQYANGSWQGDEPLHPEIDPRRAVTDTCFAILFLRRATQPMVATVDGSKRRDAAPPDKPLDHAKDGK